MPKFTTKTKGDREIYLDELWQARTHAGLLEGIPTAEMIVGTLTKGTEYLVNKCWPGKPYVILGKDFYEQRLTLGRGLRDSEERLKEQLPAYTCAALFISSKPRIEPEGEASLAFSLVASLLVVVWYQENMHPLLEGKNSAWLKEVEWERVAMDFEW